MVIVAGNMAAGIFPYGSKMPDRQQLVQSVKNVGTNTLCCGRGKGKSVSAE